MYNRRGYQGQSGPRGLQPGQGPGHCGGIGVGDVPLQLQQQLRMSGGQGVHGGTMLGMCSGINPNLNSANRGPPGISAAAAAMGRGSVNLNPSSQFLHPQQLLQNPNLMASAAGRLIVNQLHQKQQLLQMQQLRQQLQQSQLQQCQQRMGMPNNMAVANQRLNTPGLLANNLLMSQSVPNQGPSIRPQLPNVGPPLSNPRLPDNMRGFESGQETKDWKRNVSVNRGSKLSGSERFDRKDRDGTFVSQNSKDLKKAAFDQDNNRKRMISPDRRTTSTSYSYDGSVVSDSLSNRTDTDSNSRGTPVSWESLGNKHRKPERAGTGRTKNHRSNDTRSSRSKQFTDFSKGRDSSASVSSSRDGGRESDRERGRDSDREKVRDNDREKVRKRDKGRDSDYRDKGRDGDRDKSRDNDRDRSRDSDKDRNISRRIASSSSRKRHWDDPGHRKDDAEDPAPSDDKGVGPKRRREDSEGTDEDKKSDDRGKRAERHDSPESKSKKDEVAAETSPKASAPYWIRSSPADLYFTRNAEGCLEGTQKMTELEDLFEEKIVKRAQTVRSSMPDVDLPAPSPTVSVPCGHQHHNGSGACSSSDSSSDDSDYDSDDEEGMCSKWMEEMERKRKHPLCMHPELWYNDPGEMNNGPLCRCSIKARRSGIRHDIYPGEKFVEQCNPSSNNLQSLHHYRITMSPSKNFLTNSPTVIEFDNHEFIFEGFSLFTHEKLENVPLCKVIRFHIEYTIHFLEEPMPENFTIRSLDLFNKFLFSEILELVDMDWKGFGGGCNRFHLLPRFARSLPENGKEILSINEVLKFLLDSSCPLMDENDLPMIKKLDKEKWQSWVDIVCGMIVTFPGKKPSAIRVDQLDRTKLLDGEDTPPILVHFGIRPAQLSYAGNPAYQKAWKQYIKFKHLLNSKPKVLPDDKEKLKSKEALLQEIQAKSTMKREVTVELSSTGFLRTGLKSDICQHALLLPVLISHIRFHNCLNILEQHMQYVFKDRTLLQLALTHTSFRTNYGTNSAHARNSLTNCGLRHVEYGDRRVYYQNTRKRGINILVDIMARLGKKEETMSDIPHNERLEFLGDAVVEFLSSVHLFFMFPWLEEGGLSTYRTAIVQNQHLAILAKNLRLQDFMLYVHGPDLCHESDLRHAMANCFEALMGALFLDGGLETVDRIFGRTLLEDDPTCLRTWQNLPLHPLQEDEPGVDGDRHWIESSPTLQKLTSFEKVIGLKFNHIRLLAKAFTHRNVDYNVLTMGHNQRLEFLGDTVLQLIASEYLYKHFPEHHEGHLSLLRSSLVNSRTQSIVCDDLGMVDYVIYSSVGSEKASDKFDMKTKQKADLLESLLGALYVDSGMEFCRTFCDVCFFPRLKDFIENQDWNDPKSQLQQCCLTLRKMGGGEPDIPVYKVIESRGPSNTRKYVVAVYFRGERLSTGTGHSIQQAEMSAATNALKVRSELFPILQHQRRFLERPGKDDERSSTPRQYRIRSSKDNKKSSSSSSPMPRSSGRTSSFRKTASSMSNSSDSRSSSTSSLTTSRSRPPRTESRDRNVPSKSRSFDTSNRSSSSSSAANSSRSSNIRASASDSSLSSKARTSAASRTSGPSLHRSSSLSKSTTGSSSLSKSTTGSNGVPQH